MAYELPPNIKLSDNAEREQELSERAREFLKEHEHELEAAVRRIMEQAPIGEGEAAQVFPLEIPNSPCSMCVKIWRTEHQREIEAGTLSLAEYKKIQSNTPEEEFVIQDEMYQSGVRVARPISYGKIDEHDVLAMEKIPGYTLQEIMDAQGRVSVPWKELEREIIKLKQAGIVHRDIGPHNIMFETEDMLAPGVTLSGHIRIIDFGLSKRFYGSSPEPEDYETLVTDDKGSHVIHFPADNDVIARLKPKRPGDPLEKSPFLA